MSDLRAGNTQLQRGNGWVGALREEKSWKQTPHHWRAAGRQVEDTDRDMDSRKRQHRERRTWECLRGEKFKHERIWASVPLSFRRAVGGVSPPGSRRQGRPEGRGRPCPGVNPGCRSWLQPSPEALRTQRESSSQAVKLKGPTCRTQTTFSTALKITHPTVSSHLATEVLKVGTSIQLQILCL